MKKKNKNKKNKEKFMKTLLILTFLTIATFAEAYNHSVNDSIEDLIGPFMTESTIYGSDGSKYIIRGY